MRNKLQNITLDSEDFLLNFGFICVKPFYQLEIIIKSPSVMAYNLKI